MMMMVMTTLMVMVVMMTVMMTTTMMMTVMVMTTMMMTVTMMMMMMMMTLMVMVVMMMMMMTMVMMMNDEYERQGTLVVREGSRHNASAHSPEAAGAADEGVFGFPASALCFPGL